MAKILQFDNSSLLYDATETAQVKLTVAKGASATVVLDNNDNLADNDYLLFGALGYPKSEIAQINDTVAGATDVRVDTLKFAHSTGTAVTKVNFNQVEITRSATLAGSKTALTTVDIDVDNKFTTYRDTANSAGYAFFRLKNEEETLYSGYSAGYSYSTAESTTKEKIKLIIRNFYTQDVSDDILDMLIDEAIQEVYSLRNWKFREESWSFSSIAETASYTLSSISATDLAMLVYATYDGDPVYPTFMKNYQSQNWNESTSGSPLTVFQWDNALLFTPKPSEVKTIELFGYKNSSGLSDNTSETSMELPFIISYKVLQDLWSPVDPNKSNHFGSRYFEKLKLMKTNDKKQLSRFPALTRATQNNSWNDQVEFPNTITSA